MASWDTPVVQAPSTASYAAPVVNFPQMANQLQDLVIKGRAEERTEDKANAFRNGIPRDSSGNPDFNKITDTAARTGGIDYAMPLLTLQAQREAGQIGANAISPQGGPQGQPTPSPSQPPPQRATQPPAAVERVKIGTAAAVTTRRGHIELKARADSNVAPGMVFIPFCYAEAAANVLTNPQLDPFGKIPEYKFCAARVELAEHRAAAE